MAVVGNNQNPVVVRQGYLDSVKNMLRKAEGPLKAVGDQAFGMLKTATTLGTQLSAYILLQAISMVTGAPLGHESSLDRLERQVGSGSGSGSGSASGDGLLIPDTTTPFTPDISTPESSPGSMAGYGNELGVGLGVTVGVIVLVMLILMCCGRNSACQREN